MSLSDSTKSNQPKMREFFYPVPVLFIILGCGLILKARYTRKALVETIKNACPVSLFWLISSFIWNSLFPLILLGSLFVHSLYTQKKHFQIFSALLLLQAPILFIFSAGSDWRYYYFYYLAFFIALPVYLYSKPAPKRAEASERKRLIPLHISNRLIPQDNIRDAGIQKDGKRSC